MDLSSITLAVKLTDHLVDAHPLLKASWIVLASVYKAVQKQRRQDKDVIDLAGHLYEMLRVAEAYPNLRELDNKTPISQSMGLAALNVASVIEECTRHPSLLARTIQYQFKDLASRVALCKQQCYDLMKKFDRLVSLDTNADVKEVKHAVNIQQETKEREEICKWLNAPDPSPNFNSARKKRCKGTGEWLLEREGYKTWKTKPNRPFILFGTRMSAPFIFSTVIEDIASHCRREGSKSAYVYFIFDGRSSRDEFQHDKFIRSLVMQLIYPSLPPPVKKLYEDCKPYQPSTKNLEETFLKMTTCFDNVFIIVDALDECSEWPYLFKWIKSLSHHRRGKLHLFATSRPQSDLETISSVHFDLHERHNRDDIKTYVEMEMQSKRNIRKFMPKIDVSTEVSKNTNGMFRLVALRIEQLEGSLSVVDFEKQLAHLPKDLDGMYQRIIERIPAEYRQRVLRILQWVEFSMGHIRLQQLVEVAAVEFPGDPDVGVDDVPQLNPMARFEDENSVLSICGGLVSLTSDGYVTLSHMSVREYLLSKRRQQESSSFYFDEALAHSTIARTCIAYLLQFTEGLPPGDLDDAFPLAYYAAKHWYLHTTSADEAGKLKDGMLHRLTMALLLSTSAFKSFTSIHDPHDDYKMVVHYERPRVSPLYYSAVMGLRRATAEQVECLTDTDKEETANSASIRGSTEIIEILLNKGVDPNFKAGALGSPLLIAVSLDYAAVVKLLLERHADANTREPDKFQCPVLYVAVSRERTEIVKELLTHGADIHKHCNSYIGYIDYSTLEAAPGLYGPTYHYPSYHVEYVIDMSSGYDRDAGLNYLRTQRKDIPYYPKLRVAHALKPPPSMSYEQWHAKRISTLVFGGDDEDL
ncbi:hypothetical protein BDQ17DRAFT_1348524 [Cyathus striatus]|nr:hypothetical protein BDQ17DRAFT_1348524 [Cyathus striatus]